MPETKTPAADRQTKEFAELREQLRALAEENDHLQRANRELELSVSLLLEVLVPLNALYQR